MTKKVQVGNDQVKVKSEIDFLSRNRGGKKTKLKINDTDFCISGTKHSHEDWT